ncbi:hypothetical protein CF326_g1940 [Tilletia indica]|nr:hypothetical protein CF326_g1940 [Tilletia indica]
MTNQAQVPPPIPPPMFWHSGAQASVPAPAVAHNYMPTANADMAAAPADIQPQSAPAPTAQSCLYADLPNPGPPAANAASMSSGLPGNTMSNWYPA